MKVFLNAVCLVYLYSMSAAAAPSKDGKTVVHPPDGTYVPNPKHSWFAGEVITISGASFHWAYFTDAVSHTPPERQGTIKFFADYILLDEPHIPDPKRIPGVLRGVPVLWTVKGYGEWKQTGKIDEHAVLYLHKK